MSIQKLPPKFFIYALSFSLCHGVPGVIPLLPTFQQEFNLNSYEVSNCLAFFSYSALIGTPFAGYFYNKLPKNFFIFFVNFLYILGMIGAAFSPTYSTLLCFRVIQGLGSAAINLLVYVLPAEYYSGLDRAKILGKGIGAIALGLFIMPLGSGYLALFSWRYSFFFLSIPTIFTLLILLCTDLTTKFTHPYTPFTLKKVKKVFSTPFIPILFLVLSMYGGLDLSVPSLFSLFTAEVYHYTSSTIGIIYSFSNFGMFIGSAWLLTRLLQTKKFPGILLSGAFSIAILLIFFTHLPMPMFFITFFAYFCLSGILNPYLNYSISTCLSPSLLTIGITVSATIFRAGQGLGTAFFAFISSKTSYETTFILMGTVYFLLVILLIPFIFRQQRRLP